MAGEKFAYGPGHEDPKASTIGWSAARPQPMRQALPAVPVRAAGPGTGAEIRWEEFNYPPVLRVIHFDMTELPTKLRRTVRLLNFGFLLMTFTCLVNLVDSVVLWAGTSHVPAHWVLQSFLQLMVLPTAALGTFYLGYRGLAAPEPLLVHRFHIAQAALGCISGLCAIVPYHCTRGLLSLAVQEPYEAAGGVHAFWLMAVVLESVLWMLNAWLAVLNVAQVRRLNAMPSTNAFGNPPLKASS